MMSGKEERQLEESRACDHDWKPLGTTKGDTHLKLICTKCGEARLIELFP